MMSNDKYSCSPFLQFQVRIRTRILHASPVHGRYLRSNCGNITLCVRRRRRSVTRSVGLVCVRQIGVFKVTKTRTSFFALEKLQTVSGKKGAEDMACKVNDRGGATSIPLLFLEAQTNCTGQAKAAISSFL